ncbi:FAD-binding oxidoreductase [Aeromicrobium sp. UC242_57]|uniref:FAD-binding oxidoreductase n=1 Tax=Aeromicrobium sp. UC242_57 TaxID=3374624 RepID=UPI0037B367CD
MTEAPVGTAWTTGVVKEIERFGDAFVKLRLDVAGRVDHVPGQHYVLRLRAPDGYTAQRSYSIASDPDDPLVELMIECLPRGEVSSFLHEIAEVGDELGCAGPSAGGSCGAGRRRRCASRAARGSCPSCRCCGSRIAPAPSRSLRSSPRRRPATVCRTSKSWRLTAP